MTEIYLETQIDAKPAACLATHCFCEAPRFGELMVQPMNTLSALAMLMVAVFVYRKGKREGWPTFYTNVYLGALSLLFVGTAFFHATLTNFGQWTDGLGLYAVITFAGVYVLRLRMGMSHRAFLGVYLVINVLAGVFSFFFMQYRLPLFGSFVGATIVLIFYVGKNALHFPRADLWKTLALFGVGLVFQVADNRLLICSRESVWQGHALWHVLSALATYTLYLLLMRAGMRRIVK